MILVLLMAVLGEPVPGQPVDRAVRVARETLARELGVPPRRIRAHDVERVEWPDASLGCPEPGMVYAQVLTSGYRMRLEVDGKVHFMHVAGERAIRCDASTPRRAKDLRPEEALAVTRVQRLARDDLARRLKIRPSEVRAHSVRRASWPGPLGCSAAAPSPIPAAAPTTGWALELEAAGRTFRYLADAEGGTLCYEPPPEPPR